MPGDKKNHQNNPDKLQNLLTFLASSTFGSKQMMIIVDTVNFVVYINCKGNAVEAIVTHTATEASGVVRFTHCVQNLHKRIMIID
jgi:hypothetical protein